MASDYLKAVRHQRRRRHQGEWVKGLSDEQIDEFREAFALFDEDNSGQLHLLK